MLFIEWHLVSIKKWLYSGLVDPIEEPSIGVCLKSLSHSKEEFRVKEGRRPEMLAKPQEKGQCAFHECTGHSHHTATQQPAPHWDSLGKWDTVQQ